MLLNRLGGAVGDEVPDVAELGLNHRPFVLLLVLVFFLFLLLFFVGVDVQLLAHLLEHVEQGLRRGDAEIAHDDATFELDGHVVFGSQIVGIQAIEELRQRLLGHSGRDGVRGVLVGLVERGRPRLDRGASSSVRTSSRPGDGITARAQSLPCGANVRRTEHDVNENAPSPAFDLRRESTALPRW